MARYRFLEPINVQSYELDGVREFSCAVGEVELSAEDIELLGRLAPGCATLVIPVAAPVPVPVVPSEG